MNVDVTVTVNGIKNDSGTLWNVQDRINLFFSDLDADIEASITTCLHHWGLKGEVSVALAPTMGNNSVDS